jgi:type III restriction enzyme
MPLELKDYQQRALTAIERFLTAAREDGSSASLARAFAEISGSPAPYRSHGFDGTPYVCIRIPTGGGKTLMAAHAIEKTRHFVEQDCPLTIWLVPSNVIRRQTVDALKAPGHPYRQELERHFPDRVAVLDIEEIEQLRPQDIGRKAIVVVATIQTLRVDNTAGRKVYAFDENFDPHFAQVPEDFPGLERVTEADLDQHPFLTRADLGRIKRSFANLLWLHRPVVMVDEAHNARTSLSFKTLQRIRPACIIEWTSTPNISRDSGSNVLYHVGAAELQEAQMIKLPIKLVEHPRGWEEAVAAAVDTRHRLDKLAADEAEYLRPIVLFQAENKDGRVTVDVLKQHLIEKLEISEAQIAVATGDQRGLEGIDLFDRACAVRYVITIEALREGWDCSFAYVFCSVKRVASSTAVEQLLGRVLRMPYAKRRQREELNCAYAHLVSPDFAAAAQALRDRLIDMGFDPLAAALAVQPGFEWDTADDQVKPRPTPPMLILDLPALPLFERLNADDRAAVTVETAETGVKVSVAGPVRAAVRDTLLNSVSGKEQAAVSLRIEQHNALVAAMMSPSERGERFAPIPRLCIREQGELLLLEPELIGELRPWRLNEALGRFDLPGFNPDADAKEWTLGLDQAHKINILGFKDRQFALAGIDTGANDRVLARWLDREVRTAEFTQAEMLAYLSDLIGSLITARNLTLEQLWRTRFPLARAIREKLAQLRDAALYDASQGLLFGAAPVVETSFDYAFRPRHNCYHPKEKYNGQFLELFQQRQNHFFPEIGAFDNDEEANCALALATADGVRYWVRNVDSQPDNSFWIPVDNSRFYPDFIAELKDGRLLAVEYKGREDQKDARKRQMGELWARGSHGKALFLWAKKKDEAGRDLTRQIADKIAGAS